MPNDRFYTPDPLETNTSLRLSEEESHHLTRVMRVQLGEHIEVINGKGQLAKAEVTEIQKRHSVLNILHLQTEAPPTTEVILAQALPRLNRLDTIVEKGTELGITQLWLFPGQRSEKKELSDQQQQRIHTQMVSALKQCGSLFLPTLILKPALQRWDHLPYPAFFGDLSPHAPPFHTYSQRVAEGSVLFFVGPEAGFTSDEVEQMQKLQAIGVRLHQNILRTDTASLAALSIISHWKL